MCFMFLRLRFINLGLALLRKGRGRMGGVQTPAFASIQAAARLEGLTQMLPTTRSRRVRP